MRKRLVWALLLASSVCSRGPTGLGRNLTARPVHRQRRAPARREAAGLGTTTDRRKGHRQLRGAGSLGRAGRRPVAGRARSAGGQQPPADADHHSRRREGRTEERAGRRRLGLRRPIEHGMAADQDRRRRPKRSPPRPTTRCGCSPFHAPVLPSRRRTSTAIGRSSSPETVPGFTAVGYYFGRDLEKSLGVPIGLINSNIGGTTAERWMSKEVLEGNDGAEGNEAAARRERLVERHDRSADEIPDSRRHLVSGRSRTPTGPGNTARCCRR